MSKTKSIVTDYAGICFFCGKPAECEHHLLFGNGIRELAEQDGLKVPACNKCHNMGKQIERIHENIMAEKLSKMLGQASNRTMPSKTTDGGYKVPIVCGDLKEAITIFDRETLTIDISSSAGKLWETDQTGIKVRERLDIKAIDEEAIVMAEHTIKTTTDVQQTAAQSAAEETKTYTQAEIEKMSRENIIALGTKLGYTMTTTASDEKSAVVADFMAQQTAAQNK